MLSLFCFVNTFHATGLFLYPLKTSENLWFSDVFEGYRKRLVAWNGLIWERNLNSYDFVFLLLFCLGVFNPSEGTFQITGKFTSNNNQAFTSQNTEILFTVDRPSLGATVVFNLMTGFPSTFSVRWDNFLSSTYYFVGYHLIICERLSDCNGLVCCLFH